MAFSIQSNKKYGSPGVWYPTALGSSWLPVPVCLCPPRAHQGQPRGVQRYYKSKDHMPEFGNCKPEVMDFTWPLSRVRTRKPENPKTRKPENPKTRKPENLKTRNPEKTENADEGY